jgi:hypothetical protein
MMLYFMSVIYGLVEVVVEIDDPLVADPFGHLVVVHGDLLAAALDDHRVAEGHHDHRVVVDHHERGVHDPKADRL